MGMARRTRLLASMIAIVALLFAQFAVSAYACPMTGMGADTEMNANLCERHCDYGNASLDQAKSPSRTAPHPLDRPSHLIPPGGDGVRWRAPGPLVWRLR